MPDIPQTSEQMQKLTSSQDGTGRVSKLQPQSHFYIHGNDFTQDENQQFGVVNDTQFRTTATVAFSGDKAIYALCMGTVFIQPQTGSESSKVNVILRPFKQPINGLNIKYIIYRGLNKSDFFNSSSQITGSETTGSGFVQYMWKQFNKFYDVDNGGTLPASGFSSDFLGYPSPTSQLSPQENNHLIDQYFFKITTFLEEEDPVEDATTAYEFPIVPRGIELGKASGTVGIDIVLNDGDYIIENDPNPFQINLEYARSAAYVLDTATEPNTFKKKLIQEACTKFIDVAAFYGLHANGVGKLFVDTEETPKTTKADIATRLGGFNTKHNFYLYIQSNRQRSYNFYNNYTHSEINSSTIKIGITPETLNETLFRTNGWPIQVLNQAQDPATENNTVTFQLTTDNYDGAALFMQIGELASPQEENFVRGVNLLKQQPEDDTVEVDFNYTQTIQISTPAIGANTIAAFSQCIYEGKRVEVIDTNNLGQISYLKDIDDIFGLVNAKSVFALNEGQFSSIVNETLQVISFSSASTFKDIAVIKHQKVEDKIQTADGTYQDRVTYETLTHKLAFNINSYSKKTSSNYSGRQLGFSEYVSEQKAYYKPKPPYFFNIEQFYDGNNVIIGITLENIEYSLQTKKILGLNIEEMNALKELITDNSFNAKMFFQNVLGNEDSEYSSPDGVNYKKYYLKIVYEDTQSNILVVEPSIEIAVYSLDGFVYTSSSYSKNIPLYQAKDLYGFLSAK